MRQIKSLLFLRVHQGYRYLKAIGFGIIAVALFVLTGFIFRTLETIIITPSYWTPLLSILILGFIEIKRSDTFFLKSIFNSANSLRLYKFIENIIILSPIIIFQLLLFHSEVILVIITISGLFTLLPIHRVKSHEWERKSDFKWIPLSLFEIKFYFEKNKWSIWLIPILLTLGGLHISLWIVGMVFLCTLPADIYSPRESREMVRYESNFVRRKILRSMAFFTLLVMIPFIITIILNPSIILILLYGFIALQLSLVLAISKKYSTYYGVSGFAPSSTDIVILTLLMLAPGGILITISACIYYYLKAEKHMTNVYAIS